MNERTRNRDLEPFSGGEAFGFSIRDGLHIQHLDQLIDLTFQRSTIQPVQQPKITNVFARRQAWIQALRIGKNANI